VLNNLHHGGDQGRVGGEVDHAAGAVPQRQPAAHRS
jgi:hypothetical protein